MCETIAVTTHKARTRKRCIWCPGHILPGEEYRKWVGNVEGDFQANVFHPECFAAMCQVAADEGGCTTFEEHSFARGTMEEA
jgi:hypothetical protein